MSSATVSTGANDGGGLPAEPNASRRALSSGGADGHSVLWQSSMPVEVVERSDVLRRSVGSQMRRPMFHQLVVCWRGSGVHEIDFESLDVCRGTVIRVHPGQAQRFIRQKRFDASMVIWPEESMSEQRTQTTWYPGSERPTRWHLDGAGLERVRSGVEELRRVQEDSRDPLRRDRLLRTLLEALLLRLEIEVSEDSPEVTAVALPVAYVEFREMLEERLHERLSVRAIAAELGYSVRTLDRSCVSATAQTAKEILDKRMILEVRRRLLRTNLPVSQIGIELGFGAPSNFTSYVKRHLGTSPGEFRRRALLGSG